MDPSVRFQQALPYLILPISPSLSAIHASRAHRQLSAESSQDPSICRACGYYLHIGTSTSRITRSSRSKKRRALRRTCLACLDTYNKPLDPWTPSEPCALPELRVDVDVQPPLPPACVPKIAVEKLTVASTPKKIETPGVTTKAKSRTKPKNNLQAMLARNREEKARLKDAKDDNAGGGLSAFLNDL